MLLSARLATSDGSCKRPTAERLVALATHHRLCSTTRQATLIEAKKAMIMSIWPQYPTLYEINTWVWLSELSLKLERTLT